ncbi:MAG: MATE family efflux transporter, partial [Desulfotomaculaceae bacterium]|nr:MATE family efflux transporter [Desulfotomaculaceae bacterium]
MSVNIVLDGIFVSRGVGPNGLAAINISMPAFSLILAISLWIGTGGATIYSISLGKNELAYARSVFSQSILFCILLTGAIMGVCIWKIDDLAWLLGSNEIILPYVIDYLQVILVFGIVIVLENALSIFVRNDGNPTLAMAG